MIVNTKFGSFEVSGSKVEQVGFVEFNAEKVWGKATAAEVFAMILDKVEGKKRG